VRRIWVHVMQGAGNGAGRKVKSILVWRYRKAVLKPPQSRRFAAARGSPKHAKCLECGVFTVFTGAPPNSKTPPRLFWHMRRAEPCPIWSGSWRFIIESASACAV